MNEIKNLLESLRSDLRPIRSVKLGMDIDWYDVIARASLSKAFDFAHWTMNENEQSVPFFWVVGTLRGIVEEIIILSAIRPMARKDRDSILSNWMTRDTIEGTIRQTAFFALREHPQPVLTPPAGARAILSKCTEEMKSTWKSNSLNPGRQAKGNTRDLSDASGLLDIYDFLYSLTSRLVHFNPSILLRSGWGNYVNNELIAEFRTTHFNHYYRHVAMCYSSLLLAEFVERLGPSLNLPERFLFAAESIRTELAQVRLPELVTFEEMNISPLDPRRLASMVLKGEISPGQAIDRLRSLPQDATQANTN